MTAALPTVDPGDFTPAALAKIAPTCAECGSLASIVDGKLIYPQRPELWINDDGSQRWWWLCNQCGAYCGVHRGTLKPLGTPAGAETRRARLSAHAAFDPLWQKRQRLSEISKTKARNRGYQWLADQLGIRRADCHIAMMDAATAWRVVEICRAKR